MFCCISAFVLFCFLFFYRISFVVVAVCFVLFCFTFSCYPNPRTVKVGSKFNLESLLINLFGTSSLFTYSIACEDTKKKMQNLYLEFAIVRASFYLPRSSVELPYLYPHLLRLNSLNILQHYCSTNHQPFQITDMHVRFCV